METLLTIRNDDAPSGENLEYEPVFAALEMAAQPGEEKQAGDEIIAAEPPDYKDVISKALAVLEQSHDLRAAVHLAVAELHVNGFEGFARSTGYVRGCLDQFWDTCHPQLDADDDDDPTMRVNAVLGLADDRLIVRALRLTPLTQSNAFGRVTLRDIEIASGETTPSADAERVLDKSGIAAAFKDTNADTLQAIHDAAHAALEDVKAIDAIFNDRLPGQGPDLSPLAKMLQRAVVRLAEETGSETAAHVTDAGDPETAAPPAVANAGSGSGPGMINSPRDVEIALDRIMEYYASQEPSSPLPILLGRAKRLVGADFMTIMKDMAPGGVENVKVVGGIADEEEEY